MRTVARYALRAAGFTLCAIGLVAGSVYTARHRQGVLFYRDFTAELTNLIWAYRGQLTKAAHSEVPAASVAGILADVPPVIVRSSLGETVVSIAHDGIDPCGDVRCTVSGENRVLLVFLQRMLKADSKGIDVVGSEEPQPAPGQGYQLLFVIRAQPRELPDCVTVDGKLRESKADY